MSKKESTNKTNKPKKHNIKKTRVSRSNSQLKDLKQDLALEKKSI